MVLDKFPKMRQMAPQKMAFPIFLDYWFLYKKQDKQTVSLFVFNEADPWQLSFSQTARGSPEAAKFCTTATYSLGWGTHAEGRKALLLLSHRGWGRIGMEGSGASATCYILELNYTITFTTTVKGQGTRVPI